VNKGGTAEKLQAFAPCFGAEVFLFLVAITGICGTIEQVKEE